MVIKKAFIFILFTMMLSCTDKEVVTVLGLTSGASPSNTEVYMSRYEKAANHRAKSLTDARHSHTATVLSDGRVLIVGGYDGGYLSSTEIYDPVADRFSAAASLTNARENHTATALSDGDIFIFGGTGSNGAMNFWEFK